jgi:carbamoyl-phosphate synthase large subunit
VQDPRAVLVTGASGSIGFNVARCLREAEPSLFILGGCVVPLGPLYLSPIVNARYVLPRFDLNPQHYLERFLQLLITYRVSTIIPGGDVDVSFLSLFRDAIRTTGARFFVPSHSSVEIVNYKSRTYSFAATHDIPQPAFLTVDPDSVTLEAFEVFNGNMMVVKDQTTYTSIVPNATVALETCRWIGGLLGDSVVVQEYVPGREISTLSLVDEEGNILHTVAVCKLMTDKDGETREAITVDAPDIVALSERIIELLNWIGPIEIEWRVEAKTGRPLLQEINGRFPAWVYITTATGCNLVALYRELLLGCRPEGLPAPRRGVVLSRTPYDITYQMEPF